MSQSISFSTAIIRALSRLGQNGTEPPDRTNIGKPIGMAYMWDEVVRFAKAKSDAAWAVLESEGIVETPTTPGEYSLAQTPHFAVTAKVTEPIRTFDPEVLALELYKAYKVPMPATLDLVQKSKKVGKSRVTLKIIERV